MAYTRRRKTYKKHGGSRKSVFGFVPKSKSKSRRSALSNKSIKSQNLFYNCKSNNIGELRSNCNGLRDHLLKCGRLTKDIADIDDKKIAELEKELSALSNEKVKCQNKNKKLIRLNEGLITDNDKLHVENEQYKMQVNEFKSRSDTIDEIDAILRQREQQAAAKKSKTKTKKSKKTLL